MVRQYFGLLIFLLLFHICCQGQNNNLFVDFTGGGGKLFPNPKMMNLEGKVSLFNVRLGLKTLGQREWQRVYHYPEIGLGLSHNYLTTKSLGNPIAIYSFMNIPIFSASKIKLNIGMQLGIVWGFNPYTELYPKDVVIGSKIAAYSSLNLNSAFRICQHLEFLVSAEAYHLSNGNTNKPNKGINMLGAETGLRYMFSNSAFALNKEPVVPKLRNSSFRVFAAWGWMKESYTYTSRCSVGSLSAGYYRTINHKSRFSAGGDLFYDEGDLYSGQKDNQLKNVIAAGLFAGHELTFAKLSIVTQLGIYIHNPYPGDPFYYERIGLRYIIAKRIIPSLSIKIHRESVDFIEWGLGFVLWNSEN